MKKVYRKLTKDQIKRGVIFSSCLSGTKTQTEDGIMHEVLKDDKFFNNSQWSYNIIRD